MQNFDIPTMRSQIRAIDEKRDAGLTEPDTLEMFKSLSYDLMVLKIHLISIIPKAQILVCQRSSIFMVAGSFMAIRSCIVFIRCI